MMARSYLHWLMVFINVVSVSLLVPTWTLEKVFGIESALTWKYSYLYSIKQFVPELVTEIWFPKPIPVQMTVFHGVNIYFPGCAIEMVIGVFSGVVLGMDLLLNSGQRDRNLSLLMALTQFFYAGMCVTAFPLHCLKDVPMFDIEVDSPITLALFWADTVFTGSVPLLMLAAGFIENKMMDGKRGPLAIFLTLLFVCPLTYVGVVHHKPWLQFLLHIGTQVLFCTPYLFMTWKRVKSLNCPHGFHWMAMAYAYSFICGFGGFGLSVPLSEASWGLIDPLTTVFFGMRSGMIVYWIYCKDQLDCNCSNKKKKTL